MKRKTLSLFSSFLAVSLLTTSVAFADKIPPDNMPIPEPYTIFGTDNRTPVTNTSVKGANAVCNLTLVFRDPATGKNVTKYGTGFMYSKVNMGTAGHCIYDLDLETTAISMTIKPGDDPNGGIVAAQTITDRSRMHVLPEFKSTHSWEYDYGAVVLPKAFPSPVGYFGLDNEWTNSQYKNEYLTLSGYDYKTTQQYKERSNSNVIKVRSGDFDIKFDTLSGMSGSPIYTDDRYVVGIYHYGATNSFDEPKVDEDYDKAYNSAQRMNDACFDFLMEYYIAP